MPQKVERKFRHLCRKYPNLEWSGILFYKRSGTFEDNNLVITCEDFYPMDLGNATFTEFKVSEDIVGYIAEHIELFDCEMGLTHSHNRMAAFFSNTDTSTLRSEGNDTNCFVSLIVNNEGTYCAAITRKVKSSVEVTTKFLGSSYEFFGEGAVTTDEDPMSEATKVVDKEVIEYFMLDVEREVVEDPLEYLDKRFEEIEAKKRPAVSIPSVSDKEKSWWAEQNTKINYNWFDRTNSASAVVDEPALFPKEEMDEMIDVSNWYPDPTIIHYLVCQMVTCSLIVNKDIDLKQWIVRHLNKKYKEIFTDAQFNDWKEFIVEFAINQYPSDTSIEDYDIFQSRVAEAMVAELEEYTGYDYLEEYKEVLTRYIYE